MNLKEATTDELFAEYKKYEKKYQDVQQQEQAISHYLQYIEFELRKRNEYLPPKIHGDNF